MTLNVTDPWISRLVALSSLDEEHDRIQAVFRQQFAAVPHDASGWRWSALTRNGFPVEYGLVIDHGVVVGFKYTIDLCIAEPNVLDRVQHLASIVLDTRSVDALMHSARALAEPSLGRLAGVYWSLGHFRGEPPRGRLHIVGKDAALNRDALERLDSGILPRLRLRSILAAADSLQKPAVDIACLGPSSDGSLRCKLYLVSHPYIDLRRVTRLAEALGLSTGYALSLVRWYSSFVGHHEGRLGVFGVGIDASSGTGWHRVEAYAYPGNEQIPALRHRIDQHVPKMASVWRAFDRQEANGSRLALTGCGVETAPLARLGRLTAYVYPAATAASDAADVASFRRSTDMPEEARR